jgi:hypothetical protein
MAVESTSGMQARDFQGLVDAVDDNLRFAEEQVNLQLVVKQELSVRPGIQEVVFEED